MSLPGTRKSLGRFITQAEAVALLAPCTRYGQHENDSIKQAKDNVRAAIKYAIKKSELTRLPNRRFDLRLFTSWADGKWPPTTAGMIGAGTAAFWHRPKQYSIQGRVKPLKLTPAAAITARTFSPESFRDCIAEIGNLKLEVKSHRSRIRTLEGERDALKAWLIAGPPRTDAKPSGQVRRKTR